jgi:hypothetical protein
MGHRSASLSVHATKVVLQLLYPRETFLLLPQKENKLFVIAVSPINAYAVLRQYSSSIPFRSLTYKIYLLEQQDVEFRVANIIDYDVQAEGPWGLIVMSDTVYFLGWLYSLFDLCWLASQLIKATREGGELLLANLQGEAHGPLFLSRHHSGLWTPIRQHGLSAPGSRSLS